MMGWTVWGDQITRGLFHQDIQEFPNEIDKFNPLDDIQKSVIEGFGAIRERKAQGGLGWKEHEDE
jgi:hypothetical protein